MEEKTVKKRFKEAFKDNFYLSEDYAGFCKRLTRMPVKEIEVCGRKYFTISDKCISVHSFPDDTMDYMRDNKISFISVVSEENNDEESAIEYPVFFAKSYEEAYKGFNRTFRKCLRRSETQGFELRILRGYGKDSKKSVRNAYRLYLRQMKRLNGHVLPMFFFSEFMKLESSLLFALYKKSRLAGYSFCFENKNNLYTSIGGTDEKYFRDYASYRLYNEKIKYACSKGLNIHMGLGISGSGYNIFKKSCGCSLFKCESFPISKKMVKMLYKFSRFRITGIFLRAVSRLFPRKVIFRLMPFT